MRQSVTIQERIHSIDIIRGFAIFGIFFVNFATMLGIEPIIGRSYVGLDAFFRFMYDLFFQMKFYTIFSFLFGLGFYIFMNRAEARGAAAYSLFVRRLLFLFIIGILHYILLWHGDILHIYALCGFALLLFYRMKPKSILIWSLILILIFIGINWVGQSNPAFPTDETLQISTPTDQSNNLPFLGQRIAVNPSNPLEDWSMKAAGRSVMLLLLGIINFIMIIPEVVGLFLLGLYAGKTNFFQRLPEKINWLRKAQLISLVLFIGFAIPIVNMYVTSSIYTSEFVSLYILITGKALAMFYVSSLLIVSQNERWRKRLNGLSFVGRMALTNYLLQTLVTVILFSILFKNTAGIPLWIGFVYCFLFFFVQVAFSKWWLSRFPYGPVEWLWRKVTYWK